MKSKKVYACQSCKVKYAEKSWADKCENWCKTHNNTCNLDIVKHAVKH